MPHYLRFMQNIIMHFKYLRGLVSSRLVSISTYLQKRYNFARIKGSVFKSVADSVIQNELQRLQVFGSSVLRSSCGNHRGRYNVNKSVKL